MNNIVGILKNLIEREQITKPGIFSQFGGDSIIQASFEFGPPADEVALNQLVQKYDIELPTDFIEFLQLHDGAKLFDYGYGEHFEFYNIQEIDEMSEMMTPEIAPHLLPIGRYPSSCTFFIDTSRREGKCLFIGEASSEFDYLHMTFTEFLEYITRSNGTPVWEYTKLMLYRTMDDPELKVKEWSEVK